MKNILKISVIAMVLLLVGCAQPYKKDPFVKYNKYSAAQLYSKAKVALNKADYSTAVKNFEALDGLYPFGTYAKRAQMDVIYAYYAQGDNASAVVSADRFLRLYPRTKEAAYAHYMKGVASFSKGQSWLQKKFKVSPAARDTDRLVNAYQSFRALLQSYPHSIYAEDSKLRMAYIRNLIAAHIVTISEYYYSINAYQAAANRAGEVVSHFQDSNQVPQALALLVKSYRKMKLSKRAQDSYALLKANYPHSAAFKAL